VLLLHNAECLNEHVFTSLHEAPRIIEAWRVDYNAVRPHSSLGYQTPEEFAAVWHAANGGESCGAPAASACRRSRTGQGQAFGALRPSLTAPARDGLEDKRPGRKDGSAGAEQKDCGKDQREQIQRLTGGKTGSSSRRVKPIMQLRTLESPITKHGNNKLSEIVQSIANCF
jgi:integrase-like protein